MNGVKYLLDTNIILGMYPIQFRRQHCVKLPDAIIAATALAHKLEWLTLDYKLQAKL